MNGKENARRIIRFDHPERIVSGWPTHWLAYRGSNHEGFTEGGHHLPVGSRWTDIWGTVWHREHEGVMGFPRGHPLSDLPAQLATYQWPNPDDDRLIAQVHQQAKDWDSANLFLVGSHRDTLWEKSYMLVGM
jgi:hypothetical protein